MGWSKKKTPHRECRVLYKAQKFDNLSFPVLLLFVSQAPVKMWLSLLITIRTARFTTQNQKIFSATPICFNRGSY